MKYLPFIIIGFLVNLAKGEENTAVQIEKTITTQTRVWLFENPKASPEDRAAKIKKIKSDALKNFNERKLLLAKFKKQGGSIRDMYTTRAVKGVVRDRFHGDRQKFDEALQKSGLTFPEYWKIKKEEIIIDAMRSSKFGK